jgi:uncharacterized protein
MSYPKIDHGWIRVIIYLPALILIFFLFGMSAFILISYIHDYPLAELLPIGRNNISFLILYQVTTLAGVTFLTVLFRKYIDGKNPVTLGFQLFHVKKHLFLGLITGFVCISIGFSILYLSGHLSVQQINFDPYLLFLNVILFIMVSWIEELSFRGYILNNLMDSMQPYTALFISSLLFALFHIFNTGLSVIAFTNLVLAGILLGIVYIHTKTIWFALSLHFSWNFFQGPVFGFPVSGIETPGLIRLRTEGTEFISGGNFGLEGSPVCSLLLICGILALNRLFNKETK